MDCPGLFGLDLYTSSIVIATLGMVHWVVCLVPARRFRSEFFVALYLLAAFSGFVNCLLLAGILKGTMGLYWLWIWFTLLYAVVMLVSLFIMMIGFNTLQMRGMVFFPLLGIVYYSLTLYFICVVNTHRREVVRAPAPAVSARAGAAADNQTGSGPLEAVTGAPALTTRDPDKTWDPEYPTMKNHLLRHPKLSYQKWERSGNSQSGVERGRCFIPKRNPPNGEYRAALPNNQLAQPGHTYHRLRLWVFCNKHHRPRHLPYSLCYSGGWNLPLPDCVRDQSYYEEYYENDENEETTAAVAAGVCVLPRPPEHGLFMREAKISQTHISLAVRCNPLHYLVGWQRLSCADGNWNRPMPKCMFTDITVCSLLKRTDGMMLTCLPTEHYPGTYRCDAGVVPHGSVVEPRCRRDHFVWGPFAYMHCIEGQWHPRTVSWHNITCVHAYDIYRHFEIEAKDATISPEEPKRIAHNFTIINETDIFGMSIEDEDDESDEIIPLRRGLSKVVGRNVSKISSRKCNATTKTPTRKIDILDVWKSQIEGEETSDLISKQDSDSSSQRPLSVNRTKKKLRRKQKPKGKLLSVNSSKQNISQSDAKVSSGEHSIRTDFWNLQKEALKADDRIPTNLRKNKGNAKRNPRNDAGKKTRNSNLHNHRASQSKGHGKVSANFNEISIWKSESVNHGVTMKTKSSISIWKSQTQGRYFSSTRLNEICIWKSEIEKHEGDGLSDDTNKINTWKSVSDHGGDELTANTNEISIWKSQNIPSEPLSMISTKHIILKSQSESDKLVSPTLNKSDTKHFQKASKWLGVHSRKTRRLQSGL